MDDDPNIPRVPPKKIKPEYIGRMEPGWNGSAVEWRLPDHNYTEERRKEQWARYQKILAFEKENNFQDQSNVFLSDYWELVEERKRKQKEAEERMERGEKEEEEGKKEEEIIPLTRPIDYEDLEYVIDNYEYDPYDDVVNKFNDTQAENFIRSKVIEFRKSIGKQI